jgi:hypothetical protein
VDYTIARRPSLCHAAPVVQSVLVASCLANFLASVYSPECVEGAFSEVQEYLGPVGPYARVVSVLRETSIALVRAR